MGRTMAKLGTCESCGAMGNLGAMPDGYVDRDGRKFVYRGPAERAARLCTLCMLGEMTAETDGEPPAEA
jgi:hypothetical protein